MRRPPPALRTLRPTFPAPAPAGVLLLLAALLGSGCAHRSAHTPLHPPPAPPLRAAETFAAAWNIIADTHYDTNFNGLDWPQIRSEYEPQAAAATNAAALRRVIQAMLDRLGDSHMGIIPGEVADTLDPQQARQKKRSKAKRTPQPAGAPSAPGSDPADADADNNPADEEGDCGFDVRWLAHAMVVSHVDPGSPAAEAGIKPGWVLQAVDDLPVSGDPAALPPRLARLGVELLKWTVTQELLHGAPGSTVDLEFLDAADQPVKLRLCRRQAPGEKAKLGNLPVMQVHFQATSLACPPATNVGHLRFNLFMIPVAAPFDQAIDQFRRADGIILDLRGNLGGIAGMIMGLSGHFMKERTLLGTMKTRTLSMDFHANPRLATAAGQPVEPFAGPLAILTDRLSASAAEVLAGGLQCTGRARVFGEPSAGQVLLAMFDRLPNGDVLLHAFADFVTADGTRLEARGVEPNEPVPLTRADLLAGRDPALEAALRWIAAEKARQP